MALCAFAAYQASPAAQDRLKTMPGYTQYEKLTRELPGAVKPGALGVTWKDATSFDYVRDGKLYHYDVTTRTSTDAGQTAVPELGGRGGRGGRGGPERGRQLDST